MCVCMCGGMRGPLELNVAIGVECACVEEL